MMTGRGDELDHIGAFLVAHGDEDPERTPTAEVEAATAFAGRVVVAPRAPP